MAKKKLTTIYKEIIEGLGLSVDTHGGVILEEAGVKTPFTIKGKRLVLPTEEWLKNPDWEETIPFHPLSENTQRKKSVVLERLTALAANRVYQVSTTLIHFLFTLAVDTDKHKKLTPEQRDVLRLIPQADARSLTDITKLVLGKMHFKGETAFVNLFIKRNGLWKGEEYPRLTTVFFPISEFEMNKDRVLMDVPFRVRDRDAFYAIMRFIFPKFDSAEEYSYGSRSSIAPNFHSLVMALGNLLVDLNRVVKIFYDDFEEIAGLYSNVNWLKDMPNLLEYRNDIDPLDGNIGEVNEGELTKTKERAEKKEEKRERKALTRELESGRRSFVGTGERRENERLNLLGGRGHRDEPERRGSGFFRRRDEGDRYRDEDRRDDRRSSGNSFFRTGRGRDTGRFD